LARRGKIEPDELMQALWVLLPSAGALDFSVDIAWPSHGGAV
jgi:hypothetical protein